MPSPKALPSSFPQAPPSPYNKKSSTRFPAATGYPAHHRSLLHPCSPPSTLLHPPARLSSPAILLTMESTTPPPQARLHPAKAVTTGSTDKHGGAASSSPPSSSLHAVRKPPAKPWKKPTAPPPTPPKVYHVDPRDFRLLVQRLTCPEELAPLRVLRDAAPAQLDLQVPRLGAPTPSTLQLPAASVQVHGHGGIPSSSSTLEYGRGFLQREVPSGETPHQAKVETSDRAQDNTTGALSPSLYSAYLSWCNLPLPSPASMESLEQSSVL